MKLLEYPFIIITIFVLCIIVLGAVGIYFALQGVKATKGTVGKDFSNVSKLESTFNKLGKLRENRCLIYISVPLDNVRSLYSDATAWRIFSEIKQVLLHIFSEETDSCLALYDQKNFIAFNRWGKTVAEKNIEYCVNQINSLLLKNKVVNVADVHFGYYCAFATEVTFDEAINRAKQACIMAESENLSYKEWNKSSSIALEKKIKIENSIENEIDNNRFFLEYQPIVDAKTKKIVGAEVLSRLNSENEGVLTPGSFLSAVSSVGLNDKFDYYIFEKNCKWISNNKSQREEYVYTINFSRTTLCDPAFPENIIRIIEKYQLRHSSLAIEILEDKAVSGASREQMIRNIITLKKAGFLILLDDFGSGYTTFEDLHNFDIDTVKLDKNITRNAVTETGFVILKNIVRTAKDLGFKTLCEGVETEAHMQAAIRAGCDMLQGYYFYRPMPVVRLEELFKQQGEE